MIAQQLYLSRPTVESRRTRVHEKLLLASRAELIRCKLDHTLVET